MGCFNITGFHSHLPLTYGAETVLFLGVHPTYKNKDITENFISFAPGDKFTPIALPIFGKYDDYGKIENIERDDNVIAIEKFFGMDIDSLIELVDDAMVGRSYDTDKYEEFCQKIYDLQDKFIISHFEREYKIVFLLDHRFVYDTIKNFGCSCYDFEKSIKETLNFCPPWEYLHNIYPLDFDSKDEMENKFIKNEISEYDYNLWLARHTSLEGSIKWFSYLNKDLGYFSHGRTINVSLKDTNGFWYYCDGIDKSSILGVYSDTENYKTLFSDLADKYTDFLKFIAEFSLQQWCFNFHTYGSQETHCTEAMTYYKALLDKCDEIKTKYEIETEE